MNSGLGIFEDSVENPEDGPHGLAKKSNTNTEKEGKEPPYSVFEIQMDDLSGASVRLKIWSDK